MDLYTCMGIFSSIRIALTRSKSNQSVQQPSPVLVDSRPDEDKIDIHKESLKLGVAAGYTGRSIREIETSLMRIEAQMVSRDWIAAEVLPILFNLRDKYHKIDEIDHKLGSFEKELLNLAELAANLPRASRNSLEKEIKDLESLTWKMKEILNIVKDKREISYEELSAMLNYKDKSALRSLLSAMSKRTNHVERFERENKGWIRYKGDELHRSEANVSTPVNSENTEENKLN